MAAPCEENHLACMMSAIVTHPIHNTTDHRVVCARLRMAIDGH